MINDFPKLRCFSLPLLQLLSLLTVFGVTRGLRLVTSPNPLPPECPQNHAISAVSDGTDFVLILCKNGLITYQLSTDTVVDMSPRDVHTTYEAVARVGDGTIFLVGQAEGPLTQVWHISRDPGTQTWRWTLRAEIAYEFAYGSVVWDEQDHLYIMAGSQVSSTIHKFSITDFTVTDAGVLPEPKYRAAAAWLSDGGRSYAFTFGGIVNLNIKLSDEIIRYDPTDGNATTLSVRLPAPSAFMSSCWSHNEAFIVCDGQPGTTTYNFLRYDPVSNQLTVEPVDEFDFSCSNPATIYSETMNRVYMFGENWNVEQVVRYIDLDESSSPPTTTDDSSEYRFELGFAGTKLPMSCNADVASEKSAQYDGDDTVYIFCSDAIRKYQLSSDEVVDGSHLVPPFYGATTIVRGNGDDERIYGFYFNGGLTEVWQISTADLSNQALVSTLADGNFYGSVAIWMDNEEIYLIRAIYYVQEIRKFSVTDHTWAEPDEKPEPGGPDLVGAVRAPEWNSIFMIRPNDTVEGRISILRYDVDTTKTSFSGLLPIEIRYKSFGIVWTGRYAYLVCAGYPNPAHNFMRFDPVKNVVTVLPVRGFDFECHGQSVIYSSKLNRIYILGNTWLEDQPIMYIDISNDIEPTTIPPPTDIPTETEAPISTTTEDLKDGPPDCSAVDKYGSLYEAAVGELATNPCPRESNGVTTWFCVAENKFDGRNPGYYNCGSPWLEDIKDIIESGTRLNSTAAASILHGILQNLVAASSPGGNVTYYGHELKFLFRAGPAIVGLVEDFTQMNVMEELTEVAYEIVDHLLMHWSQWDELSQPERSETGTVLVHSSDSAALGLGHRSQQGQEGSSSYRKPFNRFKEFQVLSGAEELLEMEGSITFPETVYPKSDSYIEIPNDWAEYFPEEPHISFSGLRLNHGNTSALFPPVTSVLVKNSGHDNRLEPRRVVNGPLMSFSLEAGRTHNREVNFTGRGVRITFQHEVPALGPERTKIHRRLHQGEIPKAVLRSGVCVYWDDINLNWSTEGCHLISSTPTTTVCECSHLTSFAVIFDLHDYIGKPLALQILTWVLCCLSIFCLIVTIVVFLYSRFQKQLIVKHPRNDLTLNLCIALLVSNILILTTLDKHNLLLSDSACVGSAILLHYVLMCSFAWMALEGGLLAKLVLIDVFASGGEHARAWTIGAFVVPGIIVAATCAENFRRGDHAYGNDAFCCLRSFITIVAVVLIFNASVLVMAVRKSCMLASNPDRVVAQKGKSAGFWIRGALGLTFIMGLTWISGFLMLIENETVANVAAYIFTVMNASQGIFIFMFHIAPLIPIRQKLKSVIALVPSFGNSDKITEAQTQAPTIAKEE